MGAREKLEVLAWVVCPLSVLLTLACLFPSVFEIFKKKEDDSDRPSFTPRPADTPPADTESTTEIVKPGAHRLEEESPDGARKESE